MLRELTATTSNHKWFVGLLVPITVAACMLSPPLFTTVRGATPSGSHSKNASATPQPAKTQRSLVPVPGKITVDSDDQLWGNVEQRGDRQALLAAVERSLSYLGSFRAKADYSKYALPGISQERVFRSLKRFRQLLLSARSAKELQAAVEREFTFYQSTGKDGRGSVAFTGYFEPVHVASRVPTAEFRYPIFRLPSDLSNWQKPHPTRLELEGEDGLQLSNRLRGLELAWLRDRLEAFLIQVQGSARLRLTNGQVMTIGFAGGTDYPYTGVGRELVKAGKIRPEDLTLPNVINYFKQNPTDLNVYLPRNQRFVFFRETAGAPATGSLNVPVTAERSIATDKTQFPPGALALIRTQMPHSNRYGQLEQQLATRYVLDQDTGSAIKGPGRVDIFMGTGPQAGDKAGLINSTGQLYYLLLKR